MNDKEADILEEALTRFVDESLQGKQPDINEFVKQYPKCEAQLKVRIRDLKEIDFLFDTIVQTDESDFDDSAARQNLVGQKIGSFEIKGVIGSGGMGIVYLARDTRLNRPVAIKSIPAQLKDDSNARMRFKREAELLASLNHPGIAVIYDIIEQEDGSGYLVLEYVQGETLAERIARRPLEVKETLSIARQIAEAVSAAHKKGIIHRDLKPSNIKLTPEGKIKVLDFGLAKSFVSKDTDIQITSTEPGHIIGTPAYMSPEQARGKDIDHRTDIWSFGCILYQMLTGTIPFEGQTATDTLAHIIERQPDWNNLPQKTPGNIRILLSRCLEKNLEERLSDISDAAKEIGETINKPLIKPASRLLKIAMIIGAVFIITLLGITLKFLPQKEIQSSPKQIRLVVLPFENLGPSDDEWFADGMTDEITSRLAGIHGLGVVSRQSAIQYKTREKSTPQIAKELRVDYILEGTVQREKPSDPDSRVRTRCQLIKVSDDTHVWAQNYDNDMSKVFLVQSEVAEKVAKGLDIILLEPEHQALKSVPTRHMEAYVYYLQGNKYYHRRYDKSDLSNAISMYNRAISLDPNLAHAYSQLSRAHTMIFQHYDHNDSHLVLAHEAVEKALQLNPDLPEAHLALGQYYFQGLRDYDRANKELEIARKNQPINSEVLYFTGLVQGHQGKFEQSLANIKKAYELDPLSNNIAIEIGLHSMFLRKYPEAETYCKRAIFLAPDVLQAYNVMAEIYLRWDGNIEKGREIMEDALKNVKGVEYSPIMYSLVNVDIYERKYQEALDRLYMISEDVDDKGFFFPKDLSRALIYGYMDRKKLEQALYNKTQSILKSKIQEHPEDAQCHSLLGIAYAGLGYKEEAIREGKSAVDKCPVNKDAIHGLWIVKNLAQIYVMVDEYEKALDQLEYLLSVPGELSKHLLKIDPAWDPLHNHPRFKRLIE
jgi:serine/threonine protein kinase/tetratricopeptide (TPR) repeat protein